MGRSSCSDHSASGITGCSRFHARLHSPRFLHAAALAGIELHFPQPSGHLAPPVGHDHDLPICMPTNFPAYAECGSRLASALTCSASSLFIAGMDAKVDTAGPSLSHGILRSRFIILPGMNDAGNLLSDPHAAGFTPAVLAIHRSVRWRLLSPALKMESGGDAGVRRTEFNFGRGGSAARKKPYSAKIEFCTPDPSPPRCIPLQPRTH